VENEFEVNQQVGNMIGSQNNPVGPSSKGKLSLPTGLLTNINKLFESINKQAKELSVVLPKIVEDIRSMAVESDSLQNIGTERFRSKSGAINGVQQALSQSHMQKADEDFRQAPYKQGIARSAGSLAGGGMKGAAVNAGVQMALSAATTAVNLMDKRIDENANYSLSADRMSVLYQQMTGMSQVQVQDKFRQPLTNYRIGMGGINTLLGLQARTGINAAIQAPSVEALRTISGFSLGTGDVASMVESLARPETVNRMFMMTGQSLYGFGGKQRSAMDVVKNITRMSGLTNKAIVESAFQPGSVSRERLRQMGVPEEMVDTVLQYARQNVAYKEKGGKGMYNPSEKEQRKFMGIEENFATQAEETDRVRMRREEKFYSRQADNFADLERATQKLTQMFGALEDRLSGIIGARTSTRPWQSKIGGFLKGALKFGASALAGVAATAVAGPAAGFAAAGGTYAATNALTGDPVTTDGRSTETGNSIPTGNTATTSNSSSSVDQIANNNNKTNELMVPVGYRPKLVPYSKLGSTQQISQLSPTFKSKLLKLIASAPVSKTASGELISTVGVGEGFRSVKEQESGFRKRYRETDRDTGIFWNGTFWEKKPGDKSYPMAPPGMSLHNVGMAADLLFGWGDAKRGAHVRSNKWVLGNAARFGLVIPSPKGDPPHIQLAGLMGSPYKGKAVWMGTKGINWQKQGPGYGGIPTDKALLEDIKKGALPLGTLNAKFVTEQIIKSMTEGGVDPSTIGIPSLVKDIISSGLLGQSGGSVNEKEIEKWLEEAISETGTNQPPATSPNTSTSETPSTWSDGSSSTQTASGFSTQGLGKSMTSASGVSSYFGLSIDQIIKKVKANVKTKYSTYAPTSVAPNSFSVDPYGPESAGDGDFANAMSSQQAPQSAITGGSGGVAVAYSRPVIYQISPTIHIEGSASNVSHSDIKKIAKEIGSLIEQEIRIKELRRK
jgi:hypothetical protein